MGIRNKKLKVNATGDITVKEAIDLLDLDKKQIEIRQAKAQADMAELDLQERLRDQGLNSDDYCEYHFFGAVTDESILDCVTFFKYLDRNYPDAPFSIDLNSHGGYCHAGNALFDYLSSWSLRGGGQHELTITVRGEALSMGSLLLQAADHRVMGQTSQLMIHEASTVVGGRASDIEDGLNSLRLLEERAVRIFCERSGLDRDQFLGWYRRRDWWLSADEAVSLGLADRIG
ncbi:ATP-dependent Clp protease proteolytic subunit [Mycobacteroides abscessus]|uniref:ATP-dependent Clp protease proteolytic subunit n=1 Tax=Mycobacteroides abscessus TaxID=36809 RepID=UPI000D3EA4E4|nr:ATP-dependent Clp protease proteolytic subunit [Mycobacteroides abscessus]PVB19758.1 hypothetical protein DDJ40_08350 [Mycobacteroides abscessus]RIU40361.1 Clp protease ClpP [Mycobacteroides abscessus]